MPNKENEPDILYHYCSNETFLNIIKNKTIRLSDICKSNDYMEAKWLLEYIEEEAIRQYKENPFIIRDGVIHGLDGIDTIKYLIRYEKQKIMRRVDDLFYVACFSENGDKLSQWRGYADDGYGLSIGFSKNMLESISGKEELMYLRKVTYPIEVASKEISDFVRRFLESIYYAIDKGDTKDIFFDEYSSDVFLSMSTIVLLQTSLFFKNPAFVEEQEWRLVLNDELSKGDNWEDWYDSEIGKPNINGYFGERFPKGLEFRSNRNKIISYFDLLFNGYQGEIIKKIFIGPKSEVEEDDIFQILTYYGYNGNYDIVIEKSKSTYR